MTLLTICQDAATELKYAQPAQVFGNPAEEVGVMLRMAQRVGRNALERGIWPTRRAMHSFTAVAGSVQPGALPSDFGRAVPQSMWRADVPDYLIGPLNGSDWASVVAYQLVGGGPRWWTRERDGVKVWPAASGGESLSLEYFSNAFCQSAGGVPQTQWQADSDTALISEELITLGVIAYVLRNENQPFQAQMADYERELARLTRQEQPMNSLRTEPGAMQPTRYWDRWW